MKRQLRPGIACPIAICILALLMAPAGAGADPHAVQLDEVMAGAFGRLDLQFVELRLDGCHEDWGDGAHLAFFDGDDNPVGTAAFPADAPELCGSVLIATQAFADLPAMGDPDFLMPPLLIPGSGKVCFENPNAVPPVSLCLSYGEFSGDSGQASTGNAPPLVPTRTCSVQRREVFDFFGNPNFNEDFEILFPTPRNTFLDIPPRFSDVPFFTNPFTPSIEALFNAGITGGCGNGAFCPGQAVTREQMAVLLLRSAQGPGFLPPACASPAFGDVPCASPFAPWIQEMAARGITGGCGNGNFCPGSAVSREQMAVFLLLALEGPGFTPPACVTPAFGDVPCASPFAPWIQELAARGITGGCGNGNFCPGSPVTREQMAAFLTVTFALPLPSYDCSDGPEPPEEEGEDDHGDTPATATPILPGVPVAGIRERFFDVDVFSFEAQQGELYFMEAPIPGRSQGAHLLVVNANDEGLAVEFRSELNWVVFRAPASGTFFIAAHPFAVGASYELHLQGPLTDDHGEDRETATPIPLNVTTAGRAEETFDEDFFTFEVEAGRVYVFEASGQPSFLPQVVITDAAGQEVAADIPPLSATERKAMAIFQATQTGTLFAKVSTVFNFSNVGGPGLYEVVVRGPFEDGQGATAATAAPLVPGVPVESLIPSGDVDVFSFAAQAGEAYVVEVAGLSPYDSRTLELLDVDGVTVLGSTTVERSRRDDLALTASQNGTYFARVSGGPAAYRITLREPLTDDHGDTPATATPLPADGTDIPGDLELPDDEDVFSFAVTARDVFLVELTEHAPDHAPTLVVLGPDGFLAGIGTRRALIKPEVSGTCFVRVEPPSSPGTGAYRIRVRRLDDDHGDWSSEATLVTPGTPALPGAIDFRDDADFFAFDAVAGQVHTIRVEDLSGNHFGRIQLFDVDGETPLGSERGFVPVRFRVPVTGRYFLRVTSPFLESYHLTIGPGATP